MSTNNTITLDRGEIFNMDLIPVTDGADIPVDETWGCLCYIKPSCGESINLNPTLSGDKFTVSYDTSTLTESSYTGDATFIGPSGDRSVSPQFLLFINPTITPIS